MTRYRSPQEMATGRTTLMAAVLCWFFDHPGYVRERGWWNCVRCARRMPV